MYPDWSVRVSVPPVIEPLLLADVKLHCRVDTDYEDNLFSSWITAARLTLENQYSRALVTQTLILQLDDFPGWQDRIRLPRGMLQTVNSATYADTGGNVLSLTQGTDYFVDQYGYPFGQIVLPFGHVWPQLTLNTSAPIIINFTAGFTAYNAVVNVTGSAVTWESGSYFDASLLGQLVNIGGVTAQVQAFNSTTSLTLTSVLANATSQVFFGTSVPEPFRIAMKLLIGHWYQNREEIAIGRTSTIATQVPKGMDLVLADYNLSYYRPFDA